MKLNFFIKREPPEHETQKRFLDISRVVNGNIEFGNPKDGPNNIAGSWQTVLTPAAPDTEFTLVHNLGYIPTGIHVVSIDQPAIIYASRQGQWTTKQAFFKCNIASVNLVGFII